MNRLLRSVVERVVREGNLAVTGPSGETHRFGDGSGTLVHVVLNTAHAELSIALDPTLALPEAYMNCEMDFAEGDVLALLELVYRNTGAGGGVDAVWAKAIESVRYALRRLHNANSITRSRRNVARHYDLSGELYRLFLDEDMQYSCAYFDRPEMTLDEAQNAKKRHIAAKLQAKKGHSILDIGCGWGGLALYLADRTKADVLGVTLSTEQHAVATQRAWDLGLAEHVHFELRDYRALSERFDRIVSVGMFEHVGPPHYRSFFQTCATLLKPDGVMVLHSIGRSGPPWATNAFIRKHIFPGGYIPSLSEVLPEIERAGLVVTDIEILRLHYAETLRHWRERFMVNRDKAKAIYDERFCRMWEFYLAGSEAAFRWQDMMVFQVQIAKRNDAVPLTRDYVAQAERDLSDAVPPSKPQAGPRRRRAMQD